MRRSVRETHERLEGCLSELTKLRPIGLLREDVLGKELGFRAGLSHFERTLNLFYRLSKRNLAHIPHAHLQAIAAGAEKTVDQFRKIVSFTGDGIENPQQVRDLLIDDVYRSFEPISEDLRMVVDQPPRQQKTWSMSTIFISALIAAFASATITYYSSFNGAVADKLLDVLRGVGRP